MNKYENYLLKLSKNKSSKLLLKNLNKFYKYNLKKCKKNNNNKVNYYILYKISQNRITYLT